MDEEEINGVKSPIKRLGSTRKLLIFNNIRLQLNEQLKCLDMRMEAQVAFAAELQEFYRKKAEMELDHSKNLDKLATQMKNKEHKHKREWLLFSLSDLYQQLMNETKSLSKDYSALSEVYSVHLVGHLNQMMEDIQRIYKRCREIGYEIHEEILRVLNELHATMKTYQTYQAESKQAETKLCVAERQRSKLEMANTDSRLHQKLVRSKKYKLVEKEINKRRSKCQEAKLKALKARNEYLLCLEASNTTIHKYFVDDLSDLIDCMDFGFHNCLTRALHMHLSAEEGRRLSLKSSADLLGATVNSLDSRGDKQKFLESYNTAFMIPRKFEFEGHEHENTEPELQKLLRTEMEQRLQQLQNRVTTLRIESEEVYKTLETTEKSLLEMQTMKDDCTKYFGENAASTSKPPETLQIKLRADKQETEEFYLTKFREYLLATSKIARLEAKQDYIKEHLLDLNESPVPIASIIRQKTRRKIGRLQTAKQIKLFGGSLEEYLDATKEEIPLIIKSCIRIINLYGMHHQGIFRVSGSQVEIYKFKESFERGEDPLAYINDASDINSVAGLLKLYLRELREPLFPLIYFEKLIDISKLNSPNEIIIKLKELIGTLPKSIIIVLRYLFSFLNHLSDYSDENMMDANNLAVCFGPSIINIPDNYDPVISQNCINIVIKYIIIYAEDIFPDKLEGIKYEKHFDEDLDDVETEESHIGTEEPDSSNYSEEEIDVSLEELISYQSCNQLEQNLSTSTSDLPAPQPSSEPCCSKETNTEIPLRLARVPNLYCSNNISSTSRSLKIDGVFQVKPEHRVEYIEDGGGNASLDQQSVVAVDLSSPRSYHEKRNNHETSTTITSDNESQQELQTTTNFSVSRELWQRRARVRDSQRGSLSTSQTQLMPPTAKPSSYSRVSQEFREMRQKHTPDLVMDLPLLTQDSVGRGSTLSSGLSYAQTTGRCGLPVDEETMPSSLPQQQTLPSRAEATSPTGGPESPDMSTAAERFAKQNQCTLKKNTKAVNLCTGENTGGNSKLKQIETEHEESSAVIDTENRNQMTVDSSGSRGSDLIRAGRSDDFIVLPASTPKIVAKFTDMHLTGGSQMMSFKPQVKVKPTILRKPVLPYPRMSPELARKQDGT